MATSLKTVEFWFPFGTTANDATDTNLTQITVYLPESSITFRSVVLEVVFHDRNTTLGNISRRQLSLQLGSAGYTTVNNTNTITNGGEQQTLICSGDFTSHFTTNWSGTSMTCDARILADTSASSPLTPSFNNISARLVITYQYDDTSSTQIKTVRIPLNCPVGNMGTSKPSAIDTIPALDTELPEGSKTYRQTVLVAQGNDGGASTDLTIAMEVDTNGQFTSDTYEHGSNCNMFCRINTTQSFTTNSTHSFYIWCPTVGAGAHWQAWLVVTYEFSISTTSALYISVRLPFDVPGPMGGTTSSDYQRATTELWVEEPTTITTMRMAAYFFWEQQAAISGLNLRLGTGSFVGYTNAGAVNAGSNACMVRNDSAFSLSRGKNTITADVYNTDTADRGFNLSGFALINYTCAVPTEGIGAANKTIEWFIAAMGTTSPNVQNIVSATSINIPETYWFASKFGVQITYVNSGANVPPQTVTGVERLSGEGGIRWERIFADSVGTDGETGIWINIADASKVFKRWHPEPVSTRLDPETSRRWRYNCGQGSSNLAQIHTLLTYHSIYFAVNCTLGGSGGGTIYVQLLRASDDEILIADNNRVGNGSITSYWYDNVENVYMVAYEDDTHTGRSANGTAGS